MKKLLIKTPSCQKIRDELQHKLDMLCEEEKRIQHEKTAVADAIATYDLRPFKKGDEVMCEVTVGRNKKLTKCVIEVENGLVYVRPYKSDGTLSGRHFSVCCPEDGYKAIFTECGE